VVTGNIAFKTTDSNSIVEHENNLKKVMEFYCRVVEFYCRLSGHWSSIVGYFQLYLKIETLCLWSSSVAYKEILKNYLK
jgi:hypothetical protein